MRALKSGRICSLKPHARGKCHSSEHLFPGSKTAPKQVKQSANPDMLCRRDGGNFRSGMPSAMSRSSAELHSAPTSDRWPGIRLLTSGQGKDLGHEKLTPSSFDMLTAPHSPKRGRRFHAWNCVVVLVLYTLTITGIPVGAGMSSSGCHCDQQARASGRCCCSKKLNSLGKSCCSKPTTVKSCCAGKKSPQPVASSCCQAKHHSKTDTGRSVGPCGCDSPVELGLLLNIDPRLPTGPICLTDDTSFCFSIPLGNDLLQAASTAPEVPPPKFC